MPKKIPDPTIIEAAGTPPKTIKEFIGRANSKHDNVSVAFMESPEGWSEPGQRPEFTEVTFVMEGHIHVETESGETLVIGPQEAVVAEPGEWVRYRSPDPGGAKYVAVCVPAFSPETVHRDE